MISGIILASGFSRRMGKEKLLLKVGGIPMLERVIQAAQASRLDELILIYHRDEVKELGEKYRVRTVYNSHPADGQKNSRKSKGVPSVFLKARLLVIEIEPFTVPTKSRFTPSRTTCSGVTGEAMPPVLIHAMLIEAGRTVTGDHESDRAQFLGRLQTMHTPLALQSSSRHLSGTTGGTLDPIMSLGQEIDLKPHAKARVTFLTLAAASRAESIGKTFPLSVWSIHPPRLRRVSRPQ